MSKQRLARNRDYHRSTLKAYQKHFTTRVFQETGFGGEWDVDVILDDTFQRAEEWIASLRVFGEDVVLPELRYPSTWWQHFKMRWYPKWLLKWTPVKYNCYVVQGRALYPFLSAPRHEPYLEITSTSHIIWGKNDD